MATLTTSLAPDNTTATTFRAWSNGIHTAWTTFGWVQTNDTGQAVFVASVANPQPSVNNFSVTGNGTTATYTYVTSSGPAFRVGMSVTVSGFSVGGFNVTATITAIGGSTFTINNVTNASDSQNAATATTTLSATPAATTAVYEIWKAGDGLQATTPIFVKFEYGSASTNSNPAIFITLGLATDGVGNITGTMKTSQINVLGNNTSTNNVTASNCFFSGTSASMQMALFTGNTALASANCFILIERSKDSSGADTSTYFTVLTLGVNSGNVQTNYQQSLLNIAGVPPTAELNTVALFPFQASSFAFNSTTGVSPIFPLFGTVGNPCLFGVIGKGADFLDSTSFNMTQYGATHTYLSFTSSLKAQASLKGANVTTLVQMFGMRFE